MNKAIYLFVFSAFFSFTIQAQDTELSTWETYTTNEYEVKYPSNWDFKNSESSMMDFLALCPLESDDDKLRENLNLVKENAQNLDIEGYFESTKTMLNKTFPELSIIGTKDLEKNGIAMKELSYTAKFGEDVLYFTQVYAVFQNIAYVLTFTSEKEKHQNFKTTEEEIFNSFKILNY